MTPIDIQVSRSKVSVEGQSLFFICWGRGALVFYKQLYFVSRLIFIIAGDGQGYFQREANTISCIKTGGCRYQLKFARESTAF